jgi:DNA-binding LacI/PurR family transcriptional regulator
MKALKELIKEGVLVTKPGMGTFVNSMANIPFTHSHTKFKKIGLIVHNGNLVHYDLYYLKLISGVFDILSEKGVFLQLISPFNLDESFSDILETMSMDGLVWLNPGPESLTCMKSVDEADIPMLTVTIHYPECLSKHSVSSDFFQAGYLAGTHLLKEGHQKILHISNTNKKSQRTISGLKSAYKDANLTIGDEYFLEGGETLLERVEIMIDLGFKFSAVFVDGNFCLPVYDLLKKRKLRVPEDVTIVAIEDIFSKAANFNVTFVRCPLRRMGEETAESLMGLIKDRNITPIERILDWEIYSN